MTTLEKQASFKKALQSDVIKQSSFFLNLFQYCLTQDDFDYDIDHQINFFTLLTKSEVDLKSFVNKILSQPSHILAKSIYTKLIQDQEKSAYFKELFEKNSQRMLIKQNTFQYLATQPQSIHNMDIEKNAEDNIIHLKEVYANNTQLKNGFSELQKSIFQQFKIELKCSLPQPIDWIREITTLDSHLIKIHYPNYNTHLMNHALENASLSREEKYDFFITDNAVLNFLISQSSANNTKSAQALRFLIITANNETYTGSKESKSSGFTGGKCNILLHDLISLIYVASQDMSKLIKGCTSESIMAPLIEVFAGTQREYSDTHFPITLLNFPQYSFEQYIKLVEINKIDYPIIFTQANKVCFAYNDTSLPKQSIRIKDFSYEIYQAEAFPDIIERIKTVMKKCTSTSHTLFSFSTNPSQTSNEQKSFPPPNLPKT